MIKEKPIDRRTFLTIATWTIGGLISASVGIPAIAEGFTFACFYCLHYPFHY